MANKTDIELLAAPIAFSNGVEAPNRFLKSPMSERLCTWSYEDLNERGKPTQEYLNLYKHWGAGGTGILVLGNIPVDARYPECSGNPIIDMTADWDHVKAFRPIIEAAKAHGALCLPQLTHPGRQCPNNLCEQPLSPSDVTCPPIGGLSFNQPKPLTTDEIFDIVKRFGYAAKVLYEAGANGVQLHGAHGYLFSQFLSPRTNLRTDEWGGSIENRSRFHREVAQEIRRQVPDPKFILCIKFNSHDYIEGGMTEDESRQMCPKLEEWGFHCIELSGGTYEMQPFHHKRDSTRRREAFFLEFAERIRPNLKTAKLCVTGGFQSLQFMAQAVREGATDLIGIGRPLTAEPDFSNLILKGVQTRAKTNLLDQAVSMAASLLQVGQIGHEVPISDMSIQAEADEMLKSILEDNKTTLRFRPQPASREPLPRPEELKALDF